MRQPFYRLALAVAIILCLANLSVASPFAQHRLNVKLKAGWKGTREALIKYVTNELQIAKIVILLPENMTKDKKDEHAASIEKINQSGIIHSLRAEQWAHLVPDQTEQTLIIGFDKDVLRKIYRDNVALCVVAFSAGLFQDSNIRKLFHQYNNHYISRFF